MATCVLALDVGTSSVRATLYGTDGQPVAGSAARILYQVDYLPDGGVETDPDALVARVALAIDHCLAAAAGPVAAIGISCFWHSLMGVGAQGQPTTPLLIWADTRAATDVAELSRRLGQAGFGPDDLLARTGCRPHSSYPPSKLLWIRRARPAWWAATTHWLSFGEYLTYRLTGQRVASVSMASGSGLYDQYAGAWDRDLLAALDLPEDRLPAVADLAEPGLRLSAPARWPALAGASVLLPAGDGACNNVGSGAMGPDRLALMIGTSGAMRLCRAGGPWQTPPGLWQYRLDRRRGLVGGALSNGGNLHQWLTETLRLPAGPSDAALAAMPPDSHGLTFLPLLAGERSPGWAPGATGGIIGLREATSPLQIVRAAMEAVALGFAAIAADLGGGGQVIGSGGALLHSPVWAQILADAIGRDLQRSAEPEPSSRGAALLALEALGVIADVGALAPAIDAVVTADPARHLIYQRARTRLDRLYAVLAGDPTIGFGPR